MAAWSQYMWDNNICRECANYMTNHTGSRGFSRMCTLPVHGWRKYRTRPAWPKTFKSFGPSNFKSIEKPAVYTYLPTQVIYALRHLTKFSCMLSTHRENEQRLSVYVFHAPREHNLTFSVCYPRTTKTF